MSNINQITLAGYLGNDPELKYGESGKAYARLRLATHEGTKENQITTWHDCVLFGKTAEYIAANASNKSNVYVTGSLRKEKYKDQWYSKVYVNSAHVIHKPQSANAQQPPVQQQAYQQPMQQPPVQQQDYQQPTPQEEDIPF